MPRLACLVALCLLPLAAIGQTTADLRIHTRADGATYLYLPVSPRVDEVVHVTRTDADGTIQVIAEALTAAPDGATLQAALGDQVGEVLRGLQQPSADAALRLLRLDPVTGTLTAFLYPEVAQALGRLAIDTNAPMGERVTYRAEVRDRLGTATGAMFETTTILRPQTPPTPSAVEATQVDDEVTLTWTYPQTSRDTDDGVVRFGVYDVQPDGSLQRLNAAPILRNNAETRFRFTFRPEAGEASYVVTATDVARQQATSTPLSFTVEDRTPPPVLHGIEAAVAEGEVIVTWPVSVAPDAAGYHVYRGARTDGATTRLTAQPLDVLETLFTDASAQSGETYVYRVSVVDASGNESPQSNAVPLVFADTTPPEAPVSLRVEWQNGQASLTWTASPANDLDTYRVLRRPQQQRATPWTNLTPSVWRTSTFTDTSAFREGARYTYVVFALDTNSNHSDTTRTTLAVPDTTPPDAPPTFTAATDAAQTVTLRWTPTLAQDATTYTLYRNDALLASLPITQTTFRDTAAVTGQSYRYAIAATDSLGNESTRTLLNWTVRDGQPPAPVRNLVARAEDGNVLIQWEAALSDDVIGYRIERSETPTSGFAPLHDGLLPEPQFTDPAGARGQWYRVIAVDASANESVAGRAQQAR